MKVKFFCPYWGSEHLPIDQFCEKVKSEGYDGVEMGLPSDKFKKEAILNALKIHDLELIGQHYETVESDFEIHKKIFVHNLEKLANSPALFINSQTGKDHFTFDQNKALIDIAEQVTINTNKKILHETHRGKFSFAAHITKNFLENIPKLRLTLDISHWCNVAESFLDDQEAAINIAIERTDHIHSRVGYTQGAQISDPRAPEWKESVDIHLDWWDKVISRKKKEKEFTITTEFGPEPYMPLLPYSQEPIANQWEINVYMMHLLKSRYNPKI